MDHSLMRKTKKDKLWITQCKILLQQQSNELQKLSAENNTIKMRLQQTEEINKKYLNELSSFQSQLLELKKSRSEIQMQLKLSNETLQSEKESFRKILQKSTKELEKILTQNTLLRKQLGQISNVKNSALLEQKQRQKKLEDIQDKVHQLTQKNKQLEREIIGINKVHQQEVQSLRSINSTLQKGFNAIEKDYSFIMQSSEQNNFSSPILKERNIRSQSTNCRTNRPVSKINKQVRGNPEMEIELRKIKQQISNQCKKSSQNRQNAIKLRVDKTLSSIESLLTEISHRVQQSDSQASY